MAMVQLGNIQTKYQSVHLAVSENNKHLQCTSTLNINFLSDFLIV